MKKTAFTAKTKSESYEWPCETKMSKQLPDVGPSKVKGEVDLNFDSFEEKA